MLGPKRSKKKPPIEISDKDSTSTFSPPSPSPSLFRIGEKRGHPQSSPEKENQKPAKKTIKPTTTTDSTDDIPSYSISPEQYLHFALESLTKAYTGLEEEEKKKTNDILKGLVEEVRALRKEVAPTKETYAERLKKDPTSSSSLPSSSLLSPTPSTSTRSKKKQL